MAIDGGRGGGERGDVREIGELDGMERGRYNNSSIPHEIDISFSKKKKILDLGLGGAEGEGRVVSV